MRRAGHLTRRGELAVLAGVFVVLALVLEAAHASLWVRSWGLAGAAVFGLLIVACVVVTLLMAVARAVGRGVDAARIRWHRHRFTREAYRVASERLGRQSQPSPAPPQATHSCLDELARRRRLGHER